MARRRVRIAAAQARSRRRTCSRIGASVPSKSTTTATPRKPHKTSVGWRSSCAAPATHSCRSWLWRKTRRKSRKLLSASSSWLTMRSESTAYKTASDCCRLRRRAGDSARARAGSALSRWPASPASDGPSPSSIGIRRRAVRCTCLGTSYLRAETGSLPVVVPFFVRGAALTGVNTDLCAGHRDAAEHVHTLTHRTDRAGQVKCFVVIAPTAAIPHPDAVALGSRASEYVEAHVAHPHLATREREGLGRRSERTRLQTRAHAERGRLGRQRGAQVRPAQAERTAVEVPVFQSRGNRAALPQFEQRACAGICRGDAHVAHRAQPHARELEGLVFCAAFAIPRDQVRAGAR